MILEELMRLLGEIVPVQTAIFSPPAPDVYAVLVPLSDTFALYADNMPERDVQEVRISLYVKGNYTGMKDRITQALLGAGYTVTDRRYNAYEQDTGYHHISIDVAKDYEVGKEE